MADLFSFCLAIAAQIEGEPCPGEVHKLYPHGKCSLCSGSGKAPPEVCEWEEPGPTTDDMTPCRGRTIYHSPIVLICADWLEERGDPRAETLREMRIEAVGPYGGTEAFMVLPDDVPGVYYKLADAIRELLRRAIGVLTAKCPRCEDLPGMQTYRTEAWRTRVRGDSGNWQDRCQTCSGRGWVPANAVECKACGGKGEQWSINDESGSWQCPACHGQRWIKVVEKTHV